VICLGANVAAADISNSCFIGNIRDVQTANADAIPVLIDSAGQLGTISSLGRFKKGIKPMDNVSKAILALKPVTFHYTSDKRDTPQFGLLAEEVAEVNPDLVVRDKKGEIYTVRYDAVNAMLLNEFLKEHRKVEKLESTVAQLTARLKEQDSKIQKVSEQLEMNKPGSKVVANQ
jgi:predicted ribosome quality control (RQC) complex YloA/Tae2 family protein